MRRLRHLGVLVVALLTAAAPLSAAAGRADASYRVDRVVGSSIELVDGEGRKRSGADLAGIELELGDGGDTVRLRIVSVVADRIEGVLLHEVEALDPAGAWVNVCAPDRDQRRLALFIEGHDLADGRQVRVPGELSVTCTAGVQGKCIRAGYLPWDDRHGAGQGQALFQTCTRMFRADYCGDGIGWTRDGMAIDPYDIHRIQEPERPATLPFEAAWGPEGAVCVHHTRVVERGDLTALLAQCPRLARVPSGAQCTEEAAGRVAGTLMFNRSRDDAP